MRPCEVLTTPGFPSLLRWLMLVRVRQRLDNAGKKATDLWVVCMACTPTIRHALLGAGPLATMLVTWREETEAKSAVVEVDWCDEWCLAIKFSGNSDIAGSDPRINVDDLFTSVSTA